MGTLEDSYGPPGNIGCIVRGLAVDESEMLIWAPSMVEAKILHGLDMLHCPKREPFKVDAAQVHAGVLGAAF